MAVSGYQHKIINLKRKLFRCDVSDITLQFFNPVFFLFLSLKVDGPRQGVKGSSCHRAYSSLSLTCQSHMELRALPQKPQEQP